MGVGVAVVGKRWFGTAFPVNGRTLGGGVLVLRSADERGMANLPRGLVGVSGNPWSDSDSESVASESSAPRALQDPTLLRMSPALVSLWASPGGADNFVRPTVGLCLEER